MYQLLKTKETVLDKEQFKNYLTKFAADNVIKEGTNSETYPIPRLMDNFKYISLVYTLLNEHIKLNIPIHPAGEWLLDNYYLIENEVEGIQKTLTKKRYKRFPKIANGNFCGFARVLVLANEIVINTDGRITEGDLIEYIEAYQTQRTLEMEEIWNIGTFLNIALIEKIRGITEKIFSSQMQRYKVENILERIIEKKNIKKLKLDIDLYPYVEYMAYRLRTYGKKTDDYLRILEEQVEKGGMQLTDVINKEHFNIAIKKLSMQNCITSIKTVQRMDMQDVFENVNKVEKLLKQDEIYVKMDYKTKGIYRKEILELSKKLKASEIYIVKEILNLAREGKTKKEKHVGYYIISDGKYKLLSKLKNKKIKPISEKTKAKLYIFSIYALTIFFSLILSIKSVWIGLISFIPIQNIITKIFQYILSKIVKPKILPKLDYEDTKIPDESRTMCTITAILKDKETVESLINKLEVYYLANKASNLYFTLLGDCTSEECEKLETDKEIIQAGKEGIKRLNDKYGQVFNFIYRNRIWSNSERCYMGWERKRGILNELNEFLITGKNSFLVNTCENLPQIKYVITLDSDTRLELNTVAKLVAAMDHILNEPEINKITNTVCKGHALIQPRIGISIMAERKTGFTRLFAGSGGVDLYTNAISDVYQDNFDEGIYTGKGIYNVKVFHELLKDSIPENTVLSHDLLEGSYLRCGLATDILLIDDYPSNYLASKLRRKRWIRGDVQIIPWLNSTLNPLSKYKIMDNIARDSNNIWLLFLIILSFIFVNTHFNLAISIVILAIFLQVIFDFMEIWISKAENQRLIIKRDNRLFASIKRAFIHFLTVPDMAIAELTSICKSVYRMKVSHNFLLEWTTAEDAEKSSKKDLKSYYKEMIFNVILGLIFLISNNLILTILGIGFLVAPLILWKLSYKVGEEIELSTDETTFLKENAKRTWNYFKENEINGLPPDNYQEDRRKKKAEITSPTNIGLYLLAIMSSYDMSLETLEDSFSRIEKTIDAIEGLEKWNGHLYNWYNIVSLKPIKPLYISSVDSGNFAGYLYTLKQFLIEKKANEVLINRVDKLIRNTDFSKLYNSKIGLFSIGYSIEENKLTDSYYDLLATEARQTSIVAIAKRDVPSKHWNNLSRSLTKVGEYKGLISWGGTAFEYLMPSINIPSYPTTLLDESNRFSIICQQRYAKGLGIPWGISEAAYNTKDLKANYQYKTFGIPWLGLKRGLEETAVISPYSSAMSMMYYPNSAISNLEKIEKIGGCGKYGFFESIDYKPQKEIVKTFMAHHQGLILASIDNLLNDNIFIKRFTKNPEIQGVNILLEERMPDNMIVTKKGRKKVDKIKYNDYEDYVQKSEGINFLANEKYTIISKDDGKSISRYENEDISDNMRFYIKNVKSKEIYDTLEIAKNCIFTPAESKYIFQDGKLIISIKVTIVPNLPIEIRELEIKNIGNEEVTLEITSYMDVLLSKIKEYYYHPAFNKMFLEFDKIDGGIVFTRRLRNTNKKKIFVATSLVGESSDLEFEIDKENFMSRGNFGIPDSVLNSTPLGKSLAYTINPIVAMRRVINIMPEQNRKVYLVTACGDSKKEAESNLSEYVKSERLNGIFDLARANAEAEIRFLRLKGENILVYQYILENLLYPKKENKPNNFELDLSNERIWKYGISGDKPILLVKVKDKGDTYLIDEVRKANEYFKTKNIDIDIIILAEKELEAADFKVLINIPREEKRFLEERANFILDAKYGSLIIQVKEKMKEKEKKKAVPKKERNVLKEQEGFEEENRLKKENLLFYNGYGGFTNEGSEYKFMVNYKKRTPTVWSNILANEKFGSLVTEGLGGYTWYKNCRLNRITDFSNDSFLDKASERIYVEDKNNKKTWKLSLGEKADTNNYYITYGFGYAVYEHECNNLKQKNTVFVPIKDSLKINQISIKNTSLENKKIQIVYEVDWILGEYKNNFVNYVFRENLNMLLLKNSINPSYYAYVTSNEKIKIEDGKVIINLEIESLESKEITLILGAEKTEMECIEIGNKYIGKEKDALEDVKKYWKNKVEVVKAETPLKEFNIFQNGWLAYQTIASRMFAKTGFYQSGGAIGYRDQLQDAMGMKYVDKEILKNQILLHARHQFLEGDVLHWWHDDRNLGIRASYSDDLLWLPFATMDYIEFTGDYSILEKKEPYLEGKMLEEGMHDYMDNYKTSEKVGTIYEHCMKAINKTLDFEKFPKILGGDWNDGMNKVGDKKIGESIWLGFFLYSILVKFAKYSKYVTRFANKETAISLEAESKNATVKGIDSDEIADEYEKLTNAAEKLRKNLNTAGWDGRWYKRATTDEGKTLGSINNKECKIDSIAQSWATISEAGDNDKKYIAMESLENLLVDRENGLIKLLTPPFNNEEFEPGYIASYLPGMRENGGQYTHAAIWAIIAMAKLGLNEKVFEFYKMINPINHSKDEKGAEKYKVEPYVIAADVYSNKEMAGRGGWTWYTGSSSWMYMLQIEYILGIKIKQGVLKIKPCFPKDWQNAKVQIKWKNAVYNIEYQKMESQSEEIEIEKNIKMIIDGKEVEDIPLKPEGIFNIKVIF